MAITEKTTEIRSDHKKKKGQNNGHLWKKDKQLWLDHLGVETGVSLGPKAHVDV